MNKRTKKPAMEQPEKKARETARATVSFSPKVFQWANELAEEKGYDNFSSYISELVRRDKERQDEIKLARTLNTEALAVALKKKEEAEQGKSDSPSA